MPNNSEQELARITPLERATRVSDRIQIQEVILARSILKRTPDADVRAAGFKIDLDIPTYGFAKDDENRLLSVMLNFRLNGRKAESAADVPAIVIEADWVLLYTVESFDDLEQEDFDAFAQLNALFNVWPFWREYVRSASTKMSLGAITIPVHRIKKTTIDGPTSVG